MKLVSSILGCALSLAATVSGPAWANTPVAPLRAVQTDQPFQLSVYPDPLAIRDLTTSVRVLQAGVLRRALNLAPIAVAGRAVVPLALNPQSVADLPAGYYAAVLTITGTPVVAGATSFREVLPVHFRVVNGQAVALTQAAYSAATDATRVEANAVVHLGATRAAAAPIRGALSADGLITSADLGPNADRSEVGRN